MRRARDDVRLCLYARRWVGTVDVGDRRGIPFGGCGAGGRVSTRTQAAPRRRADSQVTVAAVAAAAADRVRQALLRRVCALRRLRPILVDRGRRLAAAQGVAVLSAGLLALRAPLVSLWLGAAVFGVPHLLAGVRAVAVRRRSSPVALACGALGIAVGAAQIAGVGDSALRAFVLLFAIAVGWEALSAARRRPWAALALFTSIVPGAAAAWTAPRLAVVVLAHLHGVGALLYFAIAARRQRLPVWPLCAGVTLVTAAAVGGLLDGLMATTLYAPRNATGSIVAEAITAGLPHPTAAMFHRALFVYAFGQSLHFAAWLRLLPDVERRSPTPKTFRRALADFSADFGRFTTPLLGLTVGAILLLLVGGGRAREAYFALSYFHVGLEGAALARLVFAGSTVALVQGTKSGGHSIPQSPSARRRDVQAAA